MKHSSTEPETAGERFTSLRYEELSPGPLGTFRYTVDAEAVRTWRSITQDGSSTGDVPMSFALTWFLDALREGLRGIPSGGVLTRHDLSFTTPPETGREIETEAVIERTYEKRGRSYVAFGFTSRQGGRVVATDTMHLIWPTDRGGGGDAASMSRRPAPEPVRGEELVSGEISQPQIDRYAELSADYNPLHVNPAVGAASPFRSTIAHGPIPLAYVLRGVETLHGGGWVRGLGVNARFLGPSRPGDRIRVLRVSDAEVTAIRADDGTRLIVATIGEQSHG